MLISLDQVTAKINPGSGHVFALPGSLWSDLNCQKHPFMLRRLHACKKIFDKYQKFTSDSAAAAMANGKSLTTDQRIGGSGGLELLGQV